MDRTLAEELKSACRAELLRVETEDGRFLGHVFDLRCRWRAGDERSPLDEIIYGRVGLLERVGFVERKPTSVKWSQVRQIRGRTLVVEDAAAPKE